MPFLPCPLPVPSQPATMQHSCVKLCGMVDVVSLSDIWAMKKVRATPFREQVLSLLLERGHPMTHAEILQALPGTADRVTLYRTLETLRDAEILHQVQGADGAWRFCAHELGQDGCPGGHPHFLCLTCGSMICLMGQPLQRVDISPDVLVLGKQLVVYGLCADCKREKGASPHA